MSLKLNLDYLVDFHESEIKDKYGSRIQDIFSKVINKEALGSEMTGWIEWVNKDHEDIIQAAEDLKKNWKFHKIRYVVVIGTGGSYIGCRAALEFSNSFFKFKNFQFIFVPYFSERYLTELCQFLKTKRFAILVISKSGTTLESAVAFRILRSLLYSKEPTNYRNFIAAITDKSTGTLRSLVDKENIVSFVIEDDIGGRYSTLTSVGLVPMILGGVNVRKVLDGAKKAYKECFNGNISKNSAALYASVRHYLFEEKKLVSECFACYEPHLRFSLEKAKQLFSESEGKKGKGIMPVLLNFTPDLHSVGQLLQEGHNSFFETVFVVGKNKYKTLVKRSEFNNDDNLDWVSDKSLKEINDCACSGTLEAHSKHGKINNLVVELKSWSPDVFGYLYYWLSLSAMFSSYLFGVNPFDQPGVEVYKKRMFELLGKK